MVKTDATTHPFLEGVYSAVWFWKVKKSQMSSLFTLKDFYFGQKWFRFRKQLIGNNKHIFPLSYPRFAIISRVSALCCCFLSVSSCLTEQWLLETGYSHLTQPSEKIHTFSIAALLQYDGCTQVRQNCILGCGHYVIAPLHPPQQLLRRLNTFILC